MAQKIEIDPRIMGVINLFVEKVETHFFNTANGTKALEIFAIANIKYCLDQVDFVKDEVDSQFNIQGIRMRDTEREFWERRFENYFKEATSCQADIASGSNEEAEISLITELNIIARFMNNYPKDLEVMTEKLKMARQGIAPRT